jgi:hypothetical protein
MSDGKIRGAIYLFSDDLTTPLKDSVEANKSCFRYITHVENLGIASEPNLKSTPINLFFWRLKNHIYLIKSIFSIKVCQ